MSNLDNLTQKILDDAREKAEKILAESAEKNEGIVSSKIKEATEISNKIIEKSAVEANMLKDRMISNAELRVRDEKLKAKQEIMNRIFLEAKNRLKNISEEDYIRFLTANINSIELKGTEEIIVPERMRAKISSMGTLPKVSDNESVESGFLIRDNNVVMNFSFDSLVDFLRDDLEGEIAKELFNGLE